MNAVEQYIYDNIDDCTKVNREDEGTLIGLPYPYSVPSVGFFDEMYYWDTYFFNQGLKIAGRHRQVKNNTDNMLYLVRRYGFMPNGNRTSFLKNSQPPFLSMMVYDVYNYSRDKVWLADAYSALKTEHRFWMDHRLAAIGLNRYGHNTIPKEDIDGTYQYFVGRIGYHPNLTPADAVSEFHRMCESGWDLNPRWGLVGKDFVQVDLNSLMYLFEKNMAYFSKELEYGDDAAWIGSAESRKMRMQQLMKGADGVYLDYNEKLQTRSSVFSAASFYPLFVGLADEEEAVATVRQLPRLESAFGILTCEENEEKGIFQWDYPNGWACLQYIVVMALDRYGYQEDAVRIAKKYVDLVENVYEETHNLWEKYNVIEGSCNAASSLKTPPMLGWTAGCYLALKRYIEKIKHGQSKDEQKEQKKEKL